MRPPSRVSPLWRWHLQNDTHRTSPCLGPNRVIAPLECGIIQCARPDVFAFDVTRTVTAPWIIGIDVTREPDCRRRPFREYRSVRYRQLMYFEGISAAKFREVSTFFPKKRNLIALPDDYWFFQNDAKTGTNEHFIPSKWNISGYCLFSLFGNRIAIGSYEIYQTCWIFIGSYEIGY